MFRISACFVTVLSGLLVFGLMGARQGGADSTPQGRKIPSSVGRSLNASPKENAERAALLERLERPISISVEKTSLRECISKVLATVDVRPLFDEKAISDDGSISLDDPATVQAEAESVRSVLERLLRDPMLAWIVHNGKIHVTTQTEADARLESMVYEVTDLVTNLKGEAKPWVLADLLTQHIHADSWEDVGGAGAVQWITSPRVVLLIVRQTSEIHAKVSRALTTLREMGMSSFPNGEIVELPQPPRPPVTGFQGGAICAGSESLIKAMDDKASSKPAPTMP